MPWSRATWVGTLRVVPTARSVSSKRVTPKTRSTSFDPAIALAFGKVVRQEREEQEIAQDAFAVMADVDRSYYGKLERGERQPSLALLMRIAHGLGVPPGELVNRVEKTMKRRR
jgi:DNA-binding XRE family transcriptional regulator